MPSYIRTLDFPAFHLIGEDGQLIATCRAKDKHAAVRALNTLPDWARYFVEAAWYNVEEHDG